VEQADPQLTAQAAEAAPCTSFLGIEFISASPEEVQYDPAVMTMVMFRVRPAALCGRGRSALSSQ
jgi:hypothetical protein